MLLTEKTPPEPFEEADRLMTICNACRYCEGFCAVFPAMERRRFFSEGDLTYLANLCHDCRACYHHCQYAPPHEFGVNLPRVLSQLCTDTYAQCAWPRAFGEAFHQNGVVTALATAIGLTLLIFGDGTNQPLDNTVIVERLGRLGLYLPFIEKN